MFTINEFKNFFKKDFPYCEIVEEEVIDHVGGTIEIEDPENPGSTITVPDPNDPTTYKIEKEEIDNGQCVLESEIERARMEAEFSFKGDCLSSDQKKIALMYLAAHILVLNLRNMTDGLNSQGGYGMASQSVGSVSVSFNSSPDYIKNNPLFNSLQTTGYGQRYFEMIFKCLMGSRFLYFRGRTAP